MTTIDDVLDNVAEDVFSALGQTAVYQPVVGASVACTVILKSDLEDQPGAAESIVKGASYRLRYKYAEIAKQVVRGETFTVAGNIYAVEGILSSRNNRVLEVAVRWVSTS
jgi:hypothetical protein